MSAVYCWGGHGSGQLGLGHSCGKISIPTKVDSLTGRKILHISCGVSHTLFLTEDGSVYASGNNDRGQLGHSKETTQPEQVSTLEAQTITDVCCGKSHSSALTNAGQVLTWGDNVHGQLGRGTIESEYQSSPKLVKQLLTTKVVQVVCGYEHMVALTWEGNVFSWGRNDYGQLGIGETVNKDTPELVKSIHGLPIKQIACGGNHSFVVTKSGSLFGWGNNCSGQLGLSDSRNRMYPTQCKTLRMQQVQYITCGANHSVALTKEGGVFTFGTGEDGQLGHGSTNNELLPKKVFELMGITVTQVACGRSHTIAFVPSSSRLYAFGAGESGQLGQGKLSNESTPVHIPGDWVKFELNVDGEAVTDDVTKYAVNKIFCGGDQCFVYVVSLNSSTPPLDYRISPSDKSSLTLTEDLVKKISSAQGNGVVPHDLLLELQAIFSSLACLNGSFLVENDAHYCSSRRNHGIDIEKFNSCAYKIHHCKSAIMTHLIKHSVEKGLNILTPSPPDIEALRMFLLFPYFHYFEDPANFKHAHCAFGYALMNMDRPAFHVLETWWSNLSSVEFMKLIVIYKNCVSYILQLPNAATEYDISLRQKGLLVAMEVLKMLEKVNEQNGQIVPYDSFYMSDLTTKVDVKADYLNWIQPNKPCRHKLLCFCNYPFVFDGHAKTVLLQVESVLQMQSAVDLVHRRNMHSLFTPTIDPVNPCLVLYISRENIVEDALNQLAKQGSADFKKPLRITFKGEEAVDAGGLRKEFFMLILKEILDPQYGMFKYYEESRQMWFNEITLENPGMFLLIGLLCGLAIYNSTIIDLHFPLALFKKLRKKPVTMFDLKEMMPDVARSMKQLLEYEGDDVEDVYALTFEVTRDYYGEIKHIPLKEDGANTSVNQSNKKEYVDAYIDFIFNKSVEMQFKAFSDGFLKVCGGYVLELFHPQELQAMVVGNENYDWKELKVNTEYKGVFYANYPTIIYFWEVFGELTLDEKKHFLAFLTGSDRIPILGMKMVKMIIQPMSVDDSFLPVAHTCFNLLDLPKYDSKDRLKTKLLQAIEHNKGFGLV